MSTVETHPDTPPSPADSLGKGRAKHVENHDAERAPTHGQEHVYHEGVDTSSVDERRLLRRIDYRLIPWLSFLYLLSFLDRTSIGCVSSKAVKHAILAC
jgi:hypothetical protein